MYTLPMQKQNACLLVRAAVLQSILIEAVASMGTARCGNIDTMKEQRNKRISCAAADNVWTLLRLQEISDAAWDDR
jgi:hypothetical protein